MLLNISFQKVAFLRQNNFNVVFSQKNAGIKAFMNLTPGLAKQRTGSETNKYKMAGDTCVQVLHFASATLP